jgi:membrane protein DedA with SNARE-associated domain
MSLELFSLENILEVAKNYGYLAIFWGILLENLGIPLPGETMTIVGGFLSGSNELNYWLVLGSAATGSFLGGNCGYWIGNMGGWPFLVRVGKLLRISEVRLINIKDQFNGNAAKTVFFGRFFALLRLFYAPLAGVAQMPFGKFFIFNLAGSIVWASVIVTIAFFAGRTISLEQLIAWMSQFAILLLLILVALVAISIWWESRQINKVGNDE